MYRENTTNFRYSVKRRKFIFAFYCCCTKILSVPYVTFLRKELFSLNGHKAEIVSLNFNTDGDKLMTSSFDNTAKIWDVMTG